MIGDLTAGFFFINIHLPVLGFNTLPSGHFLGDLGLTIGLIGDLTAGFFFINIHLPVLGFNTLPSGHFLGDLGLTIGLIGDLIGATLLVLVIVSIEVSLLASLRTYTNIRFPLLKLKQISCSFNLCFRESGIHFAGFKQKSPLYLIFQSYFISSQGIFLANSLLTITGSMLVRVQPLYTYLSFLQDIPAIACPFFLFIFQFANNTESKLYSTPLYTICSCIDFRVSFVAPSFIILLGNKSL